MEKILALLLLSNVSVNEQGVSLGVDILHHDLKAVEASSFWNLDFATKTFDEILIDDAIRSGKESKNV